ncbi:hypothetical protein [Nostoc punctiforme]|uniref:Uncharacterized protein n=2 Tax=Nostoc punctiforme TaxID=272131 RepID=B2ITA8_NOSP7|nr:hypothetical protein [Nostoc punctiforme]ACC81139.1 hypothetical protein Npun_R2585 [Nostoc punctiforme PCC 73102]RCJ29186.1 hypothetical protein A6769_35925 [Nostoc punctiforme NIES-2108]
MGFENGNDSTGTLQTYLIGGVDSQGKVRAIAVDENGRIQSIGEGVSITPVDSGIQRKPDIKKVSDENVIPAGTKMVFVANIGGSAGLLLETEFLPGDSVSLEATGNDTIAEISYNATDTIFMLVTLT